MKRYSGHVTNCCSKCKCCQHSCPIKKLTPSRCNTMNRKCFFGFIPDKENDCEGYSKSSRGDNIWHSQTDMKDIGGHCTKNGNHRHCKPVDPGNIFFGCKLQDNRNQKTN